MWMGEKERSKKRERGKGSRRIWTMLINCCKNEEKDVEQAFFHTPASEMSHNCIHMCAMTSFIAIIVKHELL